jgi:hypothetical protein
MPGPLWRSRYEASHTYNNNAGFLGPIDQKLKGSLPHSPVTVVKMKEIDGNEVKKVPSASSNGLQMGM